jgi:sulfite reductase (NADPH) hemoprotein beta-component
MKILQDLLNSPGQITGVEKIKSDSDFLRGTIKDSLIEEITGSFAEDDTQVYKFHGIYQQTDRSLTSERKKH